MVAPLPAAVARHEVLHSECRFGLAGRDHRIDELAFRRRELPKVSGAVPHDVGGRHGITPMSVGLDSGQPHAF